MIDNTQLKKLFEALKLIDRSKVTQKELEYIGFLLTDVKINYKLIT